jgi:hypothetical protein
MLVLGTAEHLMLYMLLCGVLQHSKCVELQPRLCHVPSGCASSAMDLTTPFWHVDTIIQCTAHCPLVRCPHAAANHGLYPRCQHTMP